MEYVAYVLSIAWQLLNLPFNIFGHTLSWGQVFLYTGVAGIVLGFVGEAFLGD